MSGALLDSILEREDVVQALKADLCLAVPRMNVEHNLSGKCCIRKLVKRKALLQPLQCICLLSQWNRRNEKEIEVRKHDVVEVGKSW